jgi:hypothetical protein
MLVCPLCRSETPYIKNGMITTYYENGSVKVRAHYTNNQLNGLYEEYYENGVKSSEFTIFEGYTESPDIDYLQSGPNATTYSDYAKLSFSAIDKKQRLNFEYFDTAPNLDSFQLNEIITAAITLSGEGHNDVNNIALLGSPSITQYQVPLNRNNSNGQYNFSINFGDSSGGFIEKLRSDFAQNFTFFCRPDWYPQDKSQNGYTNFTAFKLIDQDFIPFDNPYYSLFLSETSAESLFGIPPYEGWKPSIRSLRRTYEAPEANRIFIVGLDKTNAARISFLLQDLESQNPYLPPDERPTNWLGEVAPFVMINDKLNCETDVKQAAEQFYNKLSPGRNIIEFECDLITTWDDDQKYTPTNRENLSGQIDCTIGGTAVTGTSTAFLSEVQVGDFLYLENGLKVGYVRTINSDFSITLVSGAQTSSNGAKFYNDYTQYLNQYRKAYQHYVAYCSEKYNEILSYYHSIFLAYF